jgi:hypothetical protein
VICDVVDCNFFVFLFFCFFVFLFCMFCMFCLVCFVFELLKREEFEACRSVCVSSCMKLYQVV